jgi:putative oxidoreductase
MFSFLDKFKAYQGELLGVLRIITGVLFMAHGIQKFFAFPVAFPFPLNTMLNIAGGLEIVGGILFIIGFCTRPVAFVLSGMMAVAYFMAHATRGMYPLTNGGELAVLYCFIFLYYVASGSGKYSVDGGK